MRSVKITLKYKAWGYDCLGPNSINIKEPKVLKMFKRLFNGRTTLNYSQIKKTLNNKIILMSKSKDEIAEHGK